MKNDKQLAPFLKWAGGKRWLVPTIKTLWEGHEHRRLVEPFCGGAAIAFGLNPEKALLNDLNPHLINLYQQVKDGLGRDGISMENNREDYNFNREAFNRLNKEEETDCSRRMRAVLFYYLNRAGFNGLCRFNKKGGYNVPFGRYKKINYLSDFSEYQEAFRNWDFQCVDYEQLEIEDNDFIYADPPYDVPFRQYTAGGFSWDDQQWLAKWLSDQAVPVVASGMATDRIVELYDSLGFNIRLLKAPRRISCNGDRTPVMEMLATLNLEGAK